MSTDRSSSTTGYSRAGILFSMCLALVLVVATVSALSLGLPDLAIGIGATNNELTWIIDAYTIALAATVLPLGAVGDRYGRRNVLVLGAIIFGIASIYAGFQDSANHLIAARAVMGIGAAMIMPGTLSTITAAFPSDQRAHGVAVWSGFASGGAIIGMLATGLLLEQWKWESIFIASGIVAFVSAAAALVLSPNTHDAEETHIDLPGSILSAIGIGALVFGIIEGPERGWTDAHTLAGFAVAAVGLIGYVLWGSHTDKPLLDPRYFKLRALSAGSLVVLSQFLGLFGFFFVGLQYLQLILGYSELKAALAMVPVAVVILPMSNLTPSIVDRLGRRNVVSFGLILLAAAFYIVTQMDAGSGYMPFLIALLIGGLGLAFASTPSTTAITESLPRAKQGVASAINDTTREVGAALGIAIVGSIYASGYEGKVGEITGQLPPEAAHMVENSAAAGLQVAAQAGAQGPALADAVKDAFMTGLSDSMMVVVVILVVSAVVSWFMSPRQAVVHEEEGEAELAPESTPAV